MSATQHWRPRPWRLSATLALALAIGAIAGAWAFQLLGGLAPCPLCLTQRIPYYVGIPLGVAGLAVSFASAGNAAILARTGIALFALAMLVSVGLGGYHAGVEWGFWAGPGACSGGGSSASSVGDLLNQLDTATVVRCDEAPIRILGLSLAGWNALVSLAAAWLAIRAYPRIG